MRAIRAARGSIRIGKLARELHISQDALEIDAGYFDQSHFNREFRSVIGEAPQCVLRSSDLC